jgi:hypothetical protein
MFVPIRVLVSALSLGSLLVLGVSVAGAQDGNIVKPTCGDRSATCLHQQEIYRLSLLTSKCKVTEKVVGNTLYSICRLNSKVVSASTSLPRTKGAEDDGLGYWFENGKVVAVRDVRYGTLVTFKNGKALAIYESEGSAVRTKLTSAERQKFERTAATGARSILKEFSF